MSELIHFIGFLQGFRYVTPPRSRYVFYTGGHLKWLQKQGGCVCVSVTSRNPGVAPLH